MSELSPLALDEIRRRWARITTVSNARGVMVPAPKFARMAEDDVAALLEHIDALSERVLPRVPR